MASAPQTTTPTHPPGDTRAPCLFKGDLGSPGPRQTSLLESTSVYLHQQSPERL